jgi:GDP-4-dehydro-6-deoxy-D-mannose reductase
MKALITGISGFVGEYLAEYLISQGLEVSGTCLPQEPVSTYLQKNTKVYVLDLLDREQTKSVLEQVEPDYVFHLAAQSSVALSWKNPALTFDVNVKGAIHLLEGIRELALNPRILLIGSSEQARASNPYAISKMTQEMLGKMYAGAYSMEIVMVRAYNHTGPRQRPTFVIPDFSQRIALMEKGKMEPVLKVGNLDAVRDFSDVRDIVRAYYELVLKGKTGEVYNVGSGKGYSIKELLDRLLRLSTISIEVQPDPERMRPSDVPVSICDNSKIYEDTGWRPEIDIQKTLQDVLEYWRQKA